MISKTFKSHIFLLYKDKAIEFTIKSFNGDSTFDLGNDFWYSHERQGQKMKKSNELYLDFVPSL